jgi:threonyl-tRNA synthetase
MPERFELEYAGSDGEKHRPVMLHRAIFGSIERFIAILTEHFAGAFPLWLSPVQITVLPITDRAQAYAQKISDELASHGFRVEIDFRNEKIGYKIREAQLQKIPYMIVLGDKEAESGELAVRSRSAGDLGATGIADFIAKMKTELAEKQM